MAIYGLDVVGVPFPQGVLRKFARYRKLDLEKTPRGYWARLIGVGQSPGERDQILLAADNGHRRLHVETRHTAGGDWFGIYTY